MNSVMKKAMANRIKRRFYAAAFTSIMLIMLFGCNDIINFTGILTNRIVASNDISATIIVSVKSGSGKLLSNIQLSIIEQTDSTCVCSNKFSNNLYPIKFILPDEQINTINPQSENLIVVADYPGLCVFRQPIVISGLENDKPVIVEFTVFAEPDSLLKAPPDKYLKYKRF